ncbi:MAG: hypothetical protein DCC71_22745 [Proteobacteria bacterium]|nr:MAG: hypothetical protein DCC71_22745 [Pseudomonadota bacterium]
MKRVQRAVAIAAALAGAGVAACGANAGKPLPSEARGSTWDVHSSELAGRDLVSYRALRRSDFRAKLPPPQARAAADRLGAATCSYLVPDRETFQIRANPRQRGDGWEYVAEAEGLRFSAAMDRGCSWWNPSQRALPADYVLAHEQIHFALTEIHARELNQRGAEIVRETRAVHRDPQAAIAETTRKIEALLREESKALLARNDRFDADTSLGHRPDAQRAWQRRVEKELAETARFASGARP